MLTTLSRVVGALDKVYGIIKGNEEELKIVDMLSKDKRGVLHARGNIISVISDLIIEPKILVTNELIGNEKLYDVLNVNLDVFGSVYAQAFVVLNQIHGLDGQTTISLLSNKLQHGYGVEKFTPLLSPGVNKFSVQAGTEADKSDNKKVEVEVNSKMFKEMIRNIIVTTNITREDGKTFMIKIPIVIKPVVVYVPTSDIHKLVKTNGDSASLSAAYHAVMSGEKSVADVLFGTTLVKDYKKNRLSDRNDTLLDVENRKRQALAKVASDGAIGFGLLYQMIITSQSSKADINTLIRGKVDKDRYKDKFLNQTKSLSLTIMDDDMEMVTVYLNSLSGSFDSPYRKLSSDKSAGMKDLFDLLTMNRGI